MEREDLTPKQKAVFHRIKRFEDAIAKGREYLETGAHAQWHGFRPLFTVKKGNGHELPPHKDWVRNVSQLRTGIETGGTDARKVNSVRALGWWAMNPNPYEPPMVANQTGLRSL